MSGLFVLGSLATLLLVSGQKEENYDDALNQVNQDAPEEAVWLKITQKVPKVVHTTVGKRVNIECEAMGSPIPQLSWLKEGKQLMKSKSRRVPTTTTVASVKSRLEIDCVMKAHEGKYVCQAASGFGTIMNVSTLLLVSENQADKTQLCDEKSGIAPRIVTWSPIVMATTGQPLSISCKASARPNPNVYWLEALGKKDKDIKVLRDGTLKISTLEWSNMGEYTCVVDFPQGPEAFKTFIYPLMQEGRKTNT